MKKDRLSVVIGASPNPSRYSYLATVRLKDAGYKVRAVGIREGSIHGVPIETDRPEIPDVDTVTLYVGPSNQSHWIDYIFSLNPRRIIFNPGTVNHKFAEEAEKRGIETSIACTLVLLSLQSY